MLYSLDNLNFQTIVDDLNADLSERLKKNKLPTNLIISVTVIEVSEFTFEPAGYLENRGNNAEGS